MNETTQYVKLEGSNDINNNEKVEGLSASEFGNLWQRVKSWKLSAKDTRMSMLDEFSNLSEGPDEV